MRRTVLLSLLAHVLVACQAASPSEFPGVLGRGAGDMKVISRDSDLVAEEDQGGGAVVIALADAVPTDSPSLPASGPKGLPSSPSLAPVAKARRVAKKKLYEKYRAEMEMRKLREFPKTPFGLPAAPLLRRELVPPTPDSYSVPLYSILLQDQETLTPPARSAPIAPTPFKVRGPTRLPVPWGREERKPPADEDAEDEIPPMHVLTKVLEMLAGGFRPREVAPSAPLFKPSAPEPQSEEEAHPVSIEMIAMPSRRSQYSVPSYKDVPRGESFSYPQPLRKVVMVDPEPDLIYRVAASRSRDGDILLPPPPFEDAGAVSLGGVQALPPQKTGLPAAAVLVLERKRPAYPLLPFRVPQGAVPVRVTSLPRAPAAAGSEPRPRLLPLYKKGADLPPEAFALDQLRQPAYVGDVIRFLETASAPAFRKPAGPPAPQKRSTAVGKEDAVIVVVKQEPLDLPISGFPLVPPPLLPLADREQQQQQSFFRIGLEALDA